MKIDSCSPFLDEIILGFNPENADMGNPNGTIYGKALFIAAVTPTGRRFVHHVDFNEDEEDRAGRFAAKVLEAGEINVEHWNETFEVYGSEAWCAADAERAAAWAMDPNTAGTVRDY